MHLRVWGRGPIGRNANLHHAKGEIHLSLNTPREDTCEKIVNYVKWVLLRDPWWWQSSTLGFPLPRASYKSTSSRPPPWWWQWSILGSPWAWSSYKSTRSRPLPFLMSGLHLGPPLNMGILQGCAPARTLLIESTSGRSPWWWQSSLLGSP